MRYCVDRHKSIIAYLSANNLPNSAAALRQEVGLGEDVYDTATAKKYETLLEKKWTSIVRLQKKVGRLLSLTQLSTSCCLPVYFILFYFFTFLCSCLERSSQLTVFSIHPSR